MPPEQPAVLVDTTVAQSVADTVMGGVASPEEVAVIQDAAADSFEAHVGEGKSRQEAARLVDMAMQELMREKFTPEEIKQLEEKARANAAAAVVSRMEADRKLYDQIMRTQLAGGPEVNSHGMTVTNPELIASAESRTAA